MKQDLTNVPWNLVDDSVVPMGIANVAFLKIFFLIGERCPCVRRVVHLQTVLNTSQLEMLDDFHGVGLRRLVNAVTPRIVLNSVVSVNSDLFSVGATILGVGPRLVVVVLDPILDVRGEGA